MFVFSVFITEDCEGGNGNDDDDDDVDDNDDDDDNNDDDDGDALVSVSGFDCLETSSSHSVPLNCSGQAQKYLSPTAKQNPPFLQCKAQSSSQIINV
jgi:hypothetical protein